jgi:hypothetical protein
MACSLFIMQSLFRLCNTMLPTCFMRRQVEVETLWFQLSDLQATSSQIPLTAAAAAAAGPQSGKSSRLLQEVELHARGEVQN